MKSVLSSQTRNCVRSASRWSYRAPCTAPRFSSTSPDTRQWSTPLAKQLSEAITATGPIPLAAFMRMCLTSDVGGYYTSEQEGKDQFGQKGDFITSPEISQIFGELIGVWFVAEWMAQGKKKGVDLIEVGPGRGTLMDDMLRTIRNFKSMTESIEAVYLVEASPALRETQRKLLCGDSPMVEIDIGFKSTCKYGDIPVVWTENIRFVPNAPDRTPFIVAHEFFDALPIHAFQSVTPPPTEPQTIQTPTGVHPLQPSQATNAKAAAKAGPQWRELVVSPSPPPSTITSTTASDSSTTNPEFQLTLSSHSTPHSLYLPELSARYQNLKSTPDALIEISPDSLAYASSIATLIGGSAASPKPAPAGAALILDYGPSSTIPINSLRGIRGHKRVSPFMAPGLVDLSADVDFTALAEAAINASEGVEVHGPVEQGMFLGAMGGRERMERLSRGTKDVEKRREIEGGWKRLVERGGGGMGRVYKVMAVVPESGGRRRPVGFGGDVV